MSVSAAPATSGASAGSVAQAPGAAEVSSAAPAGPAAAPAGGRVEEFTAAQRAQGPDPALADASPAAAADKQMEEQALAEAAEEAAPTELELRWVLDWVPAQPGGRG